MSEMCLDITYNRLPSERKSLLLRLNLRFAKMTEVTICTTQLSCLLETKGGVGKSIVNVSKHKT